MAGRGTQRKREREAGNSPLPSDKARRNDGLAAHRHLYDEIAHSIMDITGMDMDNSLDNTRILTQGKKNIQVQAPTRVEDNIGNGTGSLSKQTDRANLNPLWF